MCTLGERLEYIIKYFNINKKDFAMSIKYSPGNVTDWIKGRYKPSSRALINIENIYGISQKWLIQGSGSMFIRIPESVIISENEFSQENFSSKNLSLDEIKLIKTYRKLDKKGKKKLNTFMKDLVNRLRVKKIET